MWPESRRASGHENRGEPQPTMAIVGYTGRSRTPWDRFQWRNVRARIHSAIGHTWWWRRRLLGNPTESIFDFLQCSGKFFQRFLGGVRTRSIRQPAEELVETLFDRAHPSSPLNQRHSTQTAQPFAGKLRSPVRDFVGQVPAWFVISLSTPLTRPLPDVLMGHDV